MMHIVQTDKTIDQLAADLEKAVQANKFGVMTIHNLKETLDKSNSILGQVQKGEGVLGTLVADKKAGEPS